MRGFGEANFKKSSVRIEDLVPVIPWPEGDYEQIRLFGPVFAYCNIWFTIATKRKPDGQSIPKLCLDLDGETDEFTTDICPYRASGKGRPNKWYAVNCIVRSLQEDSNGRTLRFPKPRLEITSRHGWKAYWGTKSDAKNTPVRVVIISENAAEKLVNMKKLNRVKASDGTKYYELSDQKYGCDIQIMLDPNKQGAAKVDIQKGDRTPITPEERAYIMFPLDLLKPDRLEEAKREMADLEDKIIARKDDKKDGGKGSKRKGDDGKPARRGRDEDDVDPDEDDVAEFSDGDLDEDLDADIDMEDRPRRGGKQNKRRARDEDDDLDADSDDEGYDDDGDGDSEDGDADDDDLDADLDDGDAGEDEEDERPARRGSGRDNRGSGRNDSRRAGSSRDSRDRGRDRDTRGRDDRRPRR